MKFQLVDGGMAWPRELVAGLVCLIPVNVYIFRDILNASMFSDEVYKLYSWALWSFGFTIAYHLKFLRLDFGVIRKCTLNLSSRAYP